MVFGVGLGLENPKAVGCRSHIVIVNPIEDKV